MLIEGPKALAIGSGAATVAGGLSFLVKPLFLLGCGVLGLLTDEFCVQNLSLK